MLRRRQGAVCEDFKCQNNEPVRELRRASSAYAKLPGARSHEARQFDRVSDAKAILNARLLRGFHQPNIERFAE